MKLVFIQERFLKVIMYKILCFCKIINLWKNSNTLTSQNGYTLPGVLVFKKLDDEVISLNEKPSLVFNGTNNNGDAKRTLITWSKEKGPLLDLTNNVLEANEEYFAKVIFLLEE